MKCASALVAAAAVLLLAGCSSYDPASGVVHSMQHNPQQTYLVCTSYNKGVCSVYVPDTMPESWELDVYASDSDHGWVYVEQNVYNSCHIGDTYTKDKGC